MPGLRRLDDHREPGPARIGGGVVKAWQLLAAAGCGLVAAGILLDGQQVLIVAVVVLGYAVLAALATTLSGAARRIRGQR